MIPGRGLRPHHMVSPASRISRGGTTRKFSSVPRTIGLAALPCPSNTLHSARWRATAKIHSTPAPLLPASSVRYGSWYAPWSWGRSNTPSEAPQTAELHRQPATEHVEPTTLAQEPDPVVTSATPELAPAGIDQPAVVDSAQNTVEDLLSTDSSLLGDAPAAISYWGNLKDVGLDYGWGPTAFFEHLLELCYINAELGWAGSIVLSSVVIRCGLFYFQMRASDAGAKLASMRPALQPIMNEMEAAKRNGDEEKVQAAKQKQAIIMKEAGGLDAMLSSLYMPVLQGVLGFGAFRCLRGMTNLPVPGLSSDGWLWFTDLTTPDPFYLLPLATGGIMYTIIKLGGESGMNTEMQMTSLQKQMMVAMPLFMTFITTFQPAALQLYFVCSATLGAVTSQILRRPAVRRALGLRLLPSKESQAFYTRVVNGEIKLQEVRGKDGKMRYQAPNNAQSSTTTSSSKKSPSDSPSASASVWNNIAIKPGTKLPAHMRPPAPAKVPQKYADRDQDYDVEFKLLSFSEKIDWIKRNYRPTYVWRRIVNSASGDKRDWRVKEEELRRERAKESAQKYELERKRRLEGR